MSRNEDFIWELKLSNNFAIKYRRLLRKLWTTWIKHQERIKTCCQSLFSLLLHSPIRIHFYLKYSHSSHILESTYLIQSNEKLPKNITINFHYHNFKSKICISASWNCLCQVLHETWISLPPSLLTSIWTHRKELKNFTHSVKLKPLPGPKDTRWPHAASLLSPHVLLDSWRFKSASSFPSFPPSGLDSGVKQAAPPGSPQSRRVEV